jgi:N-acetylmuramic acid 6-phosphate (MurNAc-6-P) etherase
MHTSSMAREVNPECAAAGPSHYRVAIAIGREVQTGSSRVRDSTV